jgi:hypothetical protein
MRQALDKSNPGIFEKTMPPKENEPLQPTKPENNGASKAAA